MTPPAEIDGRSFAPLLEAEAPGPESWRQVYPLAFPVACQGVPGWRGVRTLQYAYVEYETGGKELYDNAR